MTRTQTSIEYFHINFNYLAELVEQPLNYLLIAVFSEIDPNVDYGAWHFCSPLFHSTHFFPFLPLKFAFELFNQISLVTGTEALDQC